MSQSLDALSSSFRLRVFEVLARLIERDVMVMIIQTLRTPEQQAEYLARGASWTPLSTHLPRRLRGLTDEPERCDAIDLCPYAVYTAAPGGDKLAWDESHPHWQVIGEVVERIDGLRWGGRFRPPAKPDLGHVELVFHPAEVPRSA